MSNTNCDSCYYCDYCDSCYSCDSCYYCDSCDSCDSCYYCDSCDSCYYCDSCDSCKGLRMSEKMIFCLGDGRWKSSGEGYQKHLRIFNKDVTEEVYQSTLKLLRDNDVKISLTYWVEAKKMTKDDKENYSNWKELDGCLKVFTYEEAWKNWWDEATQTQKNAILNIPQFDKDIFKEITGIEVDKGVNLSGKTVKVELDGVSYEAVIK